jgi:hypothetical protein
VRSNIFHIARISCTRVVDRLKNEQLGNMDQYRATREVPLPYSFEDSYPKNHSEDEDEVTFLAFPSTSTI